MLLPCLGYYMWDLSRTQAWHLIDDPDNLIEAEVDWWMDGKIVKEPFKQCQYRWDPNDIISIAYQVRGARKCMSPLRDRSTVTPADFFRCEKTQYKTW